MFSKILNSISFLNPFFYNKVNSLEPSSKLAPKNPETGIRYHKHTFITAGVKNPPKDPKQCEEWMSRLIKKIDMKEMVAPQAYYCDMDGNRGLTCIAIIETSHIALHAWDECDPALLEFDVFSCKDYDINDVITLLREFDLASINFRCIDRTNSLVPIKLYTVYKSTNNINGEIYTGIHSDYDYHHETLDLGKLLNSAITLHGKENFSHEIVKIFFNKADAYEFEKNLVDYEFCNKPLGYNVDSNNDAKWITDGKNNLYMKSKMCENYVNTSKWLYGRTAN
jgi:S-adenosylmethionine/arginine decarboxylase-like enzyme